MITVEGKGSQQLPTLSKILITHGDPSQPMADPPVLSRALMDRFGLEVRRQQHTLTFGLEQ